MALELFYTSAPRGLKPQTSGFCTVGMSRAFPPAFVPRLEALSGYRPPHDGTSIETSPTAWSHWIVDAGGVERHVLSAVGPAAPDHTLRNNKFAHHLLLRPDELVEAGPAWVLSQPGVMAHEWIGEPRVIDAERVVPAMRATTTNRCATWEAVCGDAGWAGVIANVVMIDPSKSCSIVYPVGAPVLDLVAEALALLPAHWRWRVTFTTYFMQPIAGTRCAWRFCLDGTEAATAARASSGTVVDLCARHPCQQTGTFIDRARRGESEPVRVGAEARSPSLSARASATTVTTRPTVKKSSPPPLPQSHATPHEPAIVFGYEDVPDRKAEVRTVILWIAGVSAALLVLLTVAGVLYWKSMQPAPVAAPTQGNTPIRPARPVVAPARPTTVGPSDAAPQLLPMREAAALPEVVDQPLPSVDDVDGHAPTARVQIGSVAASTSTSEAASLTMPPRFGEWKVIEIPGPAKKIDGSWSGSAALSFGSAENAARAQSIAWAISPEKVIGDFEFPDGQSFAARNKSGVVQTIATLTTDGSQARFSWCAQSEVVRTNTKLLVEAIAALKQVPLVVSLADGTKLWCTTEKVTSIEVGEVSASWSISVATAPWQYAVNGQKWIAWDDSTQQGRDVAVVIEAAGGPVEVGTLKFSRKGSKCAAHFQLNAASDPVALSRAFERLEKKWRAARATLVAAGADRKSGAPARLANARTAEIAAKESLTTARIAYESRRVCVELLRSWEALVGSEEGVPVRITIRVPKFAALMRTRP